MRVSTPLGCCSSARRNPRSTPRVRPAGSAGRVGARVLETRPLPQQLSANPQQTFPTDAVTRREGSGRRTPQGSEGTAERKSESGLGEFLPSTAHHPESWPPVTATSHAPQVLAPPNINTVRPKPPSQTQGSRHPGRPQQLSRHQQPAPQGPASRSLQSPRPGG